MYFTLIATDLDPGMGRGPPGRGSSGGLSSCTPGCKERLMSTLKAGAQRSPRRGKTGRRRQVSHASPLLASPLLFLQPLLLLTGPCDASESPRDGHGEHTRLRSSQPSQLRNFILMEGRKWEHKVCYSGRCSWGALG